MQKFSLIFTGHQQIMEQKGETAISTDFHCGASCAHQKFMKENPDFSIFVVIKHAIKKIEDE